MLARGVAGTIWVPGAGAAPGTRGAPGRPAL
jgi:hypothetical protein